MKDIILQQRETIAEHIRAEIAKEWNAVYDTFVQNQNAFYDVVPLGTRFPGIRGCAGFLYYYSCSFSRFQNFGFCRI